MGAASVFPSTPSTYFYSGERRGMGVGEKRAETNIPGTIMILTLILPRSLTGTVWFYTSTSNKRAARPKVYTKSLTRDLKLMYSRLTLVRISINL